MKTSTEFHKKQDTRIVVCVTGCMHSGTSMITRILNLCGMNLGQKIDLLEPDSNGPGGYWENVKLIGSNNLIMQKLGDESNIMILNDSCKTGTNRLLLDAFRQAGDFINKELIGEFVGWKDPNNSMTVGFWKKALPNLKVVLCLRNPFDVAKSISESPLHNFSFQDGLLLWERYNTNVVNSISTNELIVCNYENYFVNSAEEIKRLLHQLGAKVQSPEVIKSAAASINPSQWHYRDTIIPDISKDVIKRINRLNSSLISLI